MLFLKYDRPDQSHVDNPKGGGSGSVTVASKVGEEGLAPEDLRRPATALEVGNRPESIAEAIWRFRAARMNQGRTEAGQQ